MNDFRIPQHDGRPERAEQLKAVRSAYSYRMDYGVPVTDGFRDEDEPNPVWQRKILLVQEMLHLNMRSLVREGKWTFIGNTPQLKPLTLARLLRERDFVGLLHYFTPSLGVPVEGARARDLDDFREAFARAPLPPVADTFQSDEAFAENFVAGPDPTRLRRLDSIPEKFPLTDEHWLSVPGLDGGLSLLGAIRAGRVYWVDYEAMAGMDNGTHPLGPKYMYAPMIAFATRRDGALAPFAVQCGQDPAGRQIYTPRDGYSWRMAKNCVLVAHNAYHEVVTHLGLTHLLTEPVLLSTVRNLAPAHPVAALLRRHFEGTISINRTAVDVLIQPGEPVELLIGSSLGSVYELLARERRAYSYSGNYLPERLRRQGVNDANTLGHFPYRDDGLLVWEAISRWAAEFVGCYYTSDTEVREDVELQAWAAEISSPAWGQVAAFGANPGMVTDRQDLTEILTMVMWTAGPQHAAVNFTQGDYMSFLPANPLAGFAPEPVGTGHSRRDWLDCYPPIDLAIQQFNTMTLLSSVDYTRLGDYGKDFRSTAAEKAAVRFHDDLAAIDRLIAEENAHRAFSYPYLRPSRIPSSTNI